MADLATLAAVNLSEVSPLMRGEVWTPITPMPLVQNVAQDVYDRKLTGRSYPLQFLRLQNVGTKAILVCLNDTATALKFHYVLAADTGANAGNGGVVEIFGAWNISNVSVVCTDAAGSSLAITAIVNPLTVRVNNF